MPIFGLGTYQMRGEECRAAVSSALKGGYRLIDSARVYKNEKDVAAALKDVEKCVHRDEVFITTKITPSEQGLEKCYAALLKSLKELDVDYIDLVLIHWPGVAKTPLNSLKNAELRHESWAALARAQKEGLVRSIGVSNFNTSHLQALIEFSSRNSLPVPSVNQAECHPFLNQSDLLAFCNVHGIVLQAYSSLGRASAELLTSPTVLAAAAAMSATATAAVSANEFPGGRGNPKDPRVSPAQALLCYALQRGLAVIPKSGSAARIAENADAARIFAAAGGSPLPTGTMLSLEALECGKHYCWDPATVL